MRADEEERPLMVAGAPRPLVVRLRNWVGDVLLSLPMLQRLHDAGYALHLIGKPWAPDLLAGHAWPTHVLPKTWQQRVALLRLLRQQAGALDAGFGKRLNALCLPDSFSSALEFRLAGLRALGHAWEGRSPLLSQAAPRQRDQHELLVYWALGERLLGERLLDERLLGEIAKPPAVLGLRLTTRHHEQAQQLLGTHGIEPGYLMICPFAGGTWNQQEKTWPAFAQLAQHLQTTHGRQVLLCPGPGEETLARQQFATSTVLEGVGLGAYAALLSRAALMVSNDTGPGHLAAAVNTPLVSVLGPSEAKLWQAWGRQVQVVQGPVGWPSLQAVATAVDRALEVSAAAAKSAA